MDIKDAVKENVLPFLSAKILTKFRSVSTQWDHWIQTPFLAHLQTHTFQDISGFFYQRGDTSPMFLNLDPAAYGVPMPPLGFLPGPVDLIGSCHGLLLCQARAGNNPYFICNPATKNWKQLPKPEYYHGPNSAHVLAFEPYVHNIEGHYQLVCAVPLIGQPIVCFEIYSSETGSWHCSDAICAELGEDFWAAGPGFYMKGTAYWVTSKMQVLAYDLKNEVYGIILLPTESSPGGVLAQIGDELCYISISNTSDDNYVIRINHGYDLRLRQGIDLQLEGVPAGIKGTYRVLACVGGDKLMILVGSVVYSYGLSDEKVEVVSNGGGVVGSPDIAKIVPYVNSLVRVV
ncbi:F-box protein at5g07610 [Phtheirospermum japonicum]|uniref:F-box protein at5g07610 n=1 Tax=Phtheirospermum japonicum TaxID=374723 RepID=A0A830DDJ3_9LAMI|nr:F-box protein at5g07610 [Phtheirospermum japonicum]